MQAALVQLNVTDDPAENISTTAGFIRDAAAGGARFILTPEVTNFISPNHARQRAVIRAECEDMTLRALRELASELQIHLVIGSLALLSGDGDGRFANRSFLIDPTGAILGRYDKIHMFDVTIDAAETYRESDRYRPGSQAVLVDAGFAKIGMCICYDMRFPNLSQTLAQAGAQILTFPSAFSRVSGAAHWHSLLRARAIETGCWVLAPAQTGEHRGESQTKRATWGHSLVVSPWGDVVVDGGDSPGVFHFDLEMKQVTEARRRIPALGNARNFDGP